MRALIWKELRENWKWALLAATGFALALWQGLTGTAFGQPDYYSLTQDGITLCRKQFLIVTTFGAPAIGLLFGFLQIIPELKRDRWASLLHRPVARGAIFASKALAGVALYVFATVPAFVFIVWKVATPGNFGAPFLPAMVQPGVADLATGLLYYFAALTLTLHRGGWIGLRLFPLLAAIHVSYFVLGTLYFHVALEAIGIMLVALLVAAWGVIRHQEVVGARPWLMRVAFVAVIFYGVCGLGDLGRSLLKALEPTPPSKTMRYELSRDGFPLLLTYVDGVVTSVTDATGQPVSDAKYKPDRVRNQIDYLNTASRYIGDSHGWKPTEYPRSYRSSDKYIWANSPYMYPRMEQWFQIREPRQYVGYLPVSKRAFSRLDNLGFHEPAGPVAAFPKGVDLDYVSQDTISISDRSEVKYAFLARREILPLSLPSPGPVYGLANASASSGQSYVQVMGIAQDDVFAIFDQNGRLIAQLPYQRDVERWGEISFGINLKLDRFYLRHQPSVWIDAKTRKKMPSYIDEMDAQGKVLNTYELAPLPSFARAPTFSTVLERRLRCPAFFYGEMLYRKIGALLGSERLARLLNDQWGTGRKVTMEIITWSTSISALLAIFTLFWAHASQYSWKRAWSWSAFVLLFNLAGLITFWLASDWPRLVACAQCRRRRPIDTDSCPSCGTGWTLPTLTGIEIFDQPRDLAQ